MLAYPGQVSPDRSFLLRFAWLSIGTAVLTILLKAAAWWVTGSVGLLADAAESVVNIVAALIALLALRAAAMPADHNHLFGHSKAEYLSAAAEGQMILVAAVVIGWAAVRRLLDPQPLEQLDVGIAVSVVAALLNGATAIVLLRAGRKHRSSTLSADGHHLLTDVVTTTGVVAGVLLVQATGYQRLDPILAIVVAVYITTTAFRLLRDAVNGLMDHVWPGEETNELATVLRGFVTDEVEIRGIRTRVAGHARFADLHLLVPGDWTVARAHALAAEIECSVRETMADVQLMCHMEPLRDSVSSADCDADADVRSRPPGP